MTTKKIIALTGYVGSGKETAADIILQEFKGLPVITFAKNLKIILGKVFNLEPKYFSDRVLKEATLDEPLYMSPELIDSVCRLYGYELEYNDMRPFIGRMIYSPRELMEFFGTTVLQSLDKQIHVKQEFRLAEKSDNYLVTDVRFEHEYNYLKDNFDQFQLLFIDRASAEAAAKPRKLIAEQYLPVLKTKSLIVDNNGTVEALKTNIMKYIKGSI